MKLIETKIKTVMRIYLLGKKCNQNTHIFQHVRKLTKKISNLKSAQPNIVDKIASLKMILQLKIN